MTDYQNLAKMIDKELGGSSGFCLLVFGFGAPGIANYVSNASRQEMIEALRETADRLERKEDKLR